MIHQIGPQHGRQVLAHRRGIGEHPHVAFHAGCVFLKVATELFQLADHAPCMGQQRFPRAGDLHAMTAPAEQLHAHVFLQILDPGAGSREREMRTFGAASEAAGLRDMREEFQVDEIKAHEWVRGGGKRPGMKR
ncbi:hypothetical protein D3C81_1451850 [compost metagenome]